MNPKEYIIDHIKNNYDARVQSNGIWYKFQCPFCGDSSNPNTSHFNLRVSPEDSFMVKKCFQPHCNASGILSQQDLITLGISDPKVLNFVSKKATENKEIVNRISGTTLNLKFPEGNDVVGDYFNKRTNEKLTNKNIEKYRIISSITDFYNMNKSEIDYNKRLGRLMYGEDEGNHYISFINSSGTFLQVRSIDDNNIKHMKIPLTNLPFYVSHKPYALKRNFDLKEKMYIYLAEGVFDIINSYNFFSDDGIYVQTGSASGFYSQFRNLSKYYYNIQWVFVRDEDVDLKLFKSIKRRYKYRFKYPPIIVWNEKAKDIGDFRDPIKIKKIKI